MRFVFIKMGNGLGMAKMRCMTERIDDETVSC
jgi:hypothetical protein